MFIVLEATVYACGVKECQNLTLLVIIIIIATKRVPNYE